MGDKLAVHDLLILKLMFANFLWSAIKPLDERAHVAAAHDPVFLQPKPVLHQFLRTAFINAIEAFNVENACAKSIWKFVVPKKPWQFITTTGGNRSARKILNQSQPRGAGSTE